VQARYDKDGYPDVHSSIVLASEYDASQIGIQGTLKTPWFVELLFNLFIEYNHCIVFAANRPTQMFNRLVDVLDLGKLQKKSLFYLLHRLDQGMRKNRGVH